MANELVYPIKPRLFLRTYFTRRRHREALHLFRRVYHSLDWMRQSDPLLVRRNMKGRHAAYRELLTPLAPVSFPRRTGPVIGGVDMERKTGRLEASGARIGFSAVRHSYPRRKEQR